ncbi:Uncharacterized protein Adt_04529 [Abeliophyllum distichum]|uniref:Reverse transcriptase domain-containing protein n=1 Tax=Abeliophyllum distichum TaxID=126358 RepID=A0ABD1V1I1_9LAMI
MDTGKENPEQTRSFKVDDDDENLPFSAGIKNASILYEFRVPKITHYTGKRDPLDHINTYKMEMSLRGATPALKCRAFHITLLRGAKRYYNKLIARSIYIQLAGVENDIHQLLLFRKACFDPSTTPP